MAGRKRVLSEIKPPLLLSCRSHNTRVILNSLLKFVL